MLKSYIKIACRHLLKDKIFSGITITGLAVGMAIAFLILQFLNYEIGYDHFHDNRDELFRVTSQKQNRERTVASAEVAYGVGNFMKQNCPEIVDIVRLYKWSANTGILLMARDKVYNERNYFFAEPDFFKVFSSLLVQGDPANCLKSPNSIVISKRLAIKMFGSVDVLGRSISNLDRTRQEIVITGVIRDIPENSHFDLDIVRPWEKDWTPKEASYWKGAWWTYATVRTTAPVEDIERRLNAGLKKSQSNNPDYEGTTISLQKITDIHLKSHLEAEIKPNGNRWIVYIMGVAFMAVLIIAWINYVNLETGRFIRRLKEVGIRKIIGSSKKELMLQFFVQFFLINAVALMIAGVIVYSVLPYYHLITGVPLDRTQYFVRWLWGISISFFVLGTLAAGIYPAFFLMGFNPVHALKGKLSRNVQGVFLRKSLLVFQFVASLSLVAFVIVIYYQLEFMRRANVNINLDQVLTVSNPTNYSAYEDSLRHERNAEFRNKILQNPAILNLTTSSAIPGEPVGFTYMDLAKRSLSDPDARIPYKVIYIDYDFLPVFGLKLKAGRNFSRESGEDQNKLTLVITESTVHALGFTSIEDALNKEIIFMEDDWARWKIVGVTEDYRHESVKSPVYPTIFRLHQNKGQMVYYSTLINGGSRANDVLGALQKAWQETWPEKPFDYFFLNAYYDRQFQSEIYFGRIFTVFAMVVIFIACLGIVGMTLFEANARMKEISIRKVLGASAASLLTLLTQNYFKLTMVASLFATPLIYFCSKEWLITYPVHVALSWIIFAGPVAMVVLLILLTSGFQTLKAVKANPVDSLKCE